MKSYTDIEQSKKLAEILPTDSADMWYQHVGWKHLADNSEVPIYFPMAIRDCKSDVDIPCWSLAALLDVLPEGIIENYYVPNLQKEDGKYSIAYGNDELLCIADNPIDAVFEMVCRLKENKKI